MQYSLIKTKGFTLIEVLVAMVILAVGLLGLASMQVLALKDNKDAYLLSQANFLAYEMNDRIRANAAYWQNTAIPQTVIDTAQADTPSSHPYCNIMDPPDDAVSVPGCTAAEQAEYDVYRWWQDVQRMLPNATISIIRDDDARTTDVVGNEVIDLILTWDRANQAVNISRNGAGVSTATLKLDVRL